MPGRDLEFQAVAVDRAPWATANPVRAVFREACALAHLPYFNPHLLRNTLVQLAYDLKLDAERFKAWSQNLGHESCLTTFSSYGQIPPARQAEIIRGLAHPDVESGARVDPELLRKLADDMERSQRLSR
jgi:integrase/recombinase XerD